MNENFTCPSCGGQGRHWFETGKDDLPTFHSIVIKAELKSSQGAKRTSTSYEWQGCGACMAESWSRTLAAIDGLIRGSHKS